MTVRRAARFAATALTLLAGLPAWAEATPDFGADTSAWANDGECDDPRFTGPGVAAVTVEAGRMADATDCRAAWEAGTATQADVAAGAAPAQQPAPVNAQPAQPAPAQTAAAPGGINFGDDSGQYPNDGECDDRRFTGQGMAAALGWSEAGRDASDCRALHDAGRIRLWNPFEAVAATQCASIDFGADSGEFVNNGECDDPRFEGLGSSAVVIPADSGADASDCRRLCDLGAVSLRSY